MFKSVATLETDLRRFAADGFRVSLPFQLTNSDVGKALIQLAGGKLPESLSHLADEEDRGPRHDIREAATRFVSGIMLAPDSDHFTMLGLSPDADASLLRDNFRRLMALVHPDAQPEGFPSDAATRVNHAYAVLADANARAAYVARTLVITPAVFPAIQPSPRRAPDKRREQPSTRMGDRLRGLAQALRARHVLLWLAALLLIPLGMSLMSMFSQEAPARLVEARPKLNLSLDLGSVAATNSVTGTVEPPPSPDSVAGSRVAEGDARAKQVQSIIPMPQADRNVPKRSPDAPATDLSTTAVTAKPASRSQEISTKRPVAPSLAPVSPQTVQIAPPAGAPPPATSDNPTVTARVVDATSPPPQPQATVIAASQRSAIADRADSALKMRTSEAEDVLVKFTNAYESGSIGVFGQLFASGMSGRRQMLSDYERVFLATRQRSIKFNQLKHAANGERVATSGYATVTTTDQENRTVTQRVFLEFEIGRERGEPRIERLANYVIN